MAKNPSANAGNAGDMSSIPGLGRSPGGGNGNLLQYSCLENPMNRGVSWAKVHGVQKSQIWLRHRTTHVLHCISAWHNIYQSYSEWILLTWISEQMSHLCSVPLFSINISQAAYFIRLHMRTRYCDIDLGCITESYCRLIKWWNIFNLLNLKGSFPPSTKWA